jgi:hypothetical protein
MHYAEMIEKAKELGKDAGTNAAEWFIQETFTKSNQARQNAERLIEGINEVDPMVMDALPVCDLSGEWADSMTPERLWVEVAGREWDDDSDSSDDLNELVDRYSEAFDDAVIDTVTAAAKRELEGDE